VGATYADGVASRTAIDRLRERLRRATSGIDPADEAAYADYREGFAPAVDAVMASAVAALPALLDAMSRLKTLDSAVAKLRRGSFRLSQVEDIAGVRLIVPDMKAQDSALRAWERLYPGCRVNDYRERPRCGYRSIHLVVMVSTGQLAEIQLRTPAQNLWANLSETAAAHYGMEVKYCGGPAAIRARLDATTTLTAEIDRITMSLVGKMEDAVRLGNRLDQIDAELDRLWR
jgi:ppGpp synthetase/RelA/SpoT-type nucleotidyltranferase